MRNLIPMLHQGSNFPFRYDYCQGPLPEKKPPGGTARATVEAGTVLFTEINRICLVLFDANNRMFGPYLAAINRILI
jgi:hypothetical protein